jgi:transcription factor IIIB subunit 2
MPRPAAPPRKNPLKDRPPIKAPTPLIRQAAAAAAAARAANRPPKRACPNRSCDAPDVVDGTCHNCGTIVDDSNIVSEVTFGENSSGAAVVQGTFLGADQGGARSLGPGFRRAGGGEDRAATFAEGRRQIMGLGSQFGVAESTIQVGVQIFKLASGYNFIQGRRLDMVAAICLYTACRKFTPCKVMLIDFADRVQVNVFKLGHTFRALHKVIPASAKGLQPIIPEDLIWRFASKLEFGELQDKVAEDAIRMAKRMGLDWMTVGRRPAGVVGACLILAARMNNFRRTVTEVVYVVKVTVQTIQKRLEEFKQTPSSELTVDAFLSNEFLESAHDPPSFYQNTEEYKSKQKKRKRRRYGHDGDELPDEENSGAEDTDEVNKRQRTTEPTSEQLDPSVEQLRIDADGFAIPAQPIVPQQDNAEVPIDPALMVAEMDKELEKATGTSFSQLVSAFGDGPGALEVEEEEGETDEMDIDNESSPGTPRRRGRPKVQDVRVPEEWQNSELEMEGEISELISDPNTIEHAANYARAKKRAAVHMIVAALDNPQKPVSMDAHVGEDEFANDPEVQNCLLSPEDVAKKEKLWVNENKGWLRQQQLKMWEAKQAANRPPKAKRNRVPKPRMGEGQVSAASTPVEAATNALKARSMSKKINYGAIGEVFDGVKFLKNQGIGLGSASTSRVTSRAGSEYPESEVGSVDGSEHSFLIAPKSRQKKKAPIVINDEEVGSEDDYVDPDAEPPRHTREIRQDDEPSDDWKAALKGPPSDGEEEEEEFVEEEDFDDGNGDIESAGLLDDEDGAFAADREYGNDDEYGYGDDDGY